MAVRSEQLVEGGSVFLRVQIPRPGAQSETRLKPARVVDVERAAATIQVLDENRTRTVRFAQLEPDIDYLARLLSDRDIEPRKTASLGTIGDVVTKRVAVSNEQTPTPIVQTLLDLQTAPPDELAPEPTTPSSSTPCSSTEVGEDDERAWLELGQQLRARLDEQLAKATPEQAAKLLARRGELETKLQERAREARDMSEAERMAAKKKHGQRYTDAQKRAVLDAIADGVSSKDAARLHGVSYWTVREWSKHAATRTPRATAATRPAPVVALPSKPRRGRERVEVPEVEDDDDETEAEQTVDAAAVRRDNRRLRAILTSLLDRSDASDTAQLASQNRQLQLVIDLLLGID